MDATHAYLAFRFVSHKKTSEHRIAVFALLTIDLRDYSMMKASDGPRSSSERLIVHTVYSLSVFLLLSFSLSTRVLSEQVSYLARNGYSSITW